MRLFFLRTWLILVVKYFLEEAILQNFVLPPFQRMYFYLETILKKNLPKYSSLFTNILLINLCKILNFRLTLKTRHRYYPLKFKRTAGRRH